VEVYILDSLFRRTAVFDKFESLIWTERFSELGDFELDLKSTLENRAQFLPGTRLAINNSYRVMTVETVEDNTDTDGKEMLKVKGHSLEALLEDRVARNAMTDTVTEPSWALLGTPGNIARAMFDHVVRTHSLDPLDAIPFLQPGSIFPADTIPESLTEITWVQNPDSLFNAIKAICDAYDLGFRLVRNFDMSQLYFDIYAGLDRTTQQSTVPPVIFSVGLDNIQNTTEYQTIEKSKNVAYVFSDAGFEVVYGPNVDPDTDGFDRHVMVVNVTIEAGDPDPTGTMIQAGTEALMANRASAYFDGEVNQYNEYVYGVDYNVGDLVEMRNKDGIITYKKVTEQIFVSDDQGERSYPTLTADLFAGTNTWLEWTNKSTVWLDYDADLTAWGDLDPIGIL
jgi:hypothetical protein